MTNDVPSNNTPSQSSHRHSIPILSESIEHRFGGIVRLYGRHALMQLQRSHVLIIGIGGVGSWTAEALARTGVGSITLMDLDDLCVTNTNRQIHALKSTVGHSKIQVMEQRLKDINPEITVHLIHDFLDYDTIDQYIDGSHSIIVDAIDMGIIKTKLINYCKKKRFNVLTIGSAGGKRDPQKITSADLSKTINDPMLSKMRNNLRRLYGFPRDPKQKFGITAIYSTEPMTYPDDNGGVCQSKAFIEKGAKLDCNLGFGAASMVTATFGFIAATEAVRKIIQ